MAPAVYTGEQRTAASEIIDFIYSLPVFSGLPVLLAEYSIEKYLISGMRVPPQLIEFHSRLSGMDPSSVNRLLLVMLRSKTSEKVLSVFRSFIEGADFSFFDLFSSKGSVSNDFRREKLYALVEALLSREGARRGMNSAYTVFRYGIVERYINAIWRGHRDVYESLASVDSRVLEPPEAEVFFKTALILVNSRRVTGGGSGKNEGQSFDNQEDIIFQPSAAFPGVLTECPRSTPSEDGRFRALPMAGDFVDILDLRFRNTGYYGFTVKGCMSADVSWFDTARKNRIVKMNPQLAGIFYETALENNW